MAEEDEDPIARFEELLDARLSRKPKPKAKPPGVASSRRRGGDSSDDDDDEEAATDPGGVIRLTVQPPCVKGGVMRDYQLEGLNWMISLHACGLNGILADEMGLGKTLQSISLLGYLSLVEREPAPHLVVVPLTVLGNWCKEIERWCPGLRAVRLHGNKDERRSIIETQARAAAAHVPRHRARTRRDASPPRGAGAGMGKRETRQEDAEGVWETGKSGARSPESGARSAAWQRASAARARRSRRATSTCSSPPTSASRPRPPRCASCAGGLLRSARNAGLCPGHVPDASTPVQALPSG